jgi:hypothetical protein
MPYKSYCIHEKKFKTQGEVENCPNYDPSFCRFTDNCENYNPDECTLNKGNCRFEKNENFFCTVKLCSKEKYFPINSIFQ